MKSKLTVIAALVSIAFTGLPASGQSAEAMYRARMIGFLAKGQCLLKNGSITEEFRDAATRTYLRDNPELKPAFEWVTTSINGKAAVKAMTMNPHYDINCNLLLSNKEAGAVIMPYLK